MKENANKVGIYELVTLEGKPVVSCVLRNFLLRSLDNNNI